MTRTARACRTASVVISVVCITLAGEAGAQGTTIPPGRLIGAVVDSATGAPLSAALARVAPTHALEPTHADGTFVFERLEPGDYTLYVSMLGYAQATRTVRIVAGETTRVDVALHVSAIQLDQLVVTGTVDPRASRDMISPISVVAGAELDRRIDATVAGTLRNEPGIAVGSLGPTTARPVIRGLGGDRIVFLEDGIRPGDLSSTSSDHAVAIEPLTALRFEVVRGPMSLLYGSSALGGVVNVVRDEVPTSVPEHLHGELIANGMSASEGLAGAAFASAGRGPFAMRVEASKRTSNDVRTPAGDLENTGADSYNLAAGAAVVGSLGHVGFSYRLFDNDYGIPGGFVGGHAHGVDIQLQRQTFRAQGELHRSVGPFSTLRGSAAYTDYHHAELELSGDVGTAFAQDLWSAELQARHEPRGILAQGAIGLSGQYRDIRTAGSLHTPSTYDYTFAVYAVQEVALAALRLQVGLRFDHAHYVPRDTSAFVVAGGTRIPVRERTFGAVSGSVGALYIVNSAVRLGASVSRAYRTPDFNELYSNGPHLAANSFDVGDPTLGQETGLGVDVFTRVSTSRLAGEFALFWNRLDDYAFPSSRGRYETGAQGGRPRFQYTNEDARFSGAEAQLNWSPIDRIVVESTASLVNARFTSHLSPIPVVESSDTSFIAASVYPPLIPPLHGNVDVRYELPRWFAGASFRWSAAQDRLGDFEDRTASYTVGGLSAGVRIPQGARLHTITLRIDNITDVEYRNHLSRIKNIMPEPGRDISIVYRLAF